MVMEMDVLSSDKALSLDSHAMAEQIVIALMSCIHIGWADVFQTSADAMLLLQRTSGSQILW